MLMKSIAGELLLRSRGSGNGERAKSSLPVHSVALGSITTIIMQCIMLSDDKLA